MSTTLASFWRIVFPNNLNNLLSGDQGAFGKPVSVSSCWVLGELGKHIKYGKH